MFSLLTINTKIDSPLEFPNTSQATDGQEWLALMSVYSLEYDGLRREIEIHRKNQDDTQRSVLTLLIGLGSLVALFVDPAAEAFTFLSRHSWVYLTVSLITLALPLHYAHSNLFLIRLGIYIRDELAPRLRYISAAVAARCIPEMQSWELERFGVIGPLLWENNHPAQKPQRTWGTLGAISVFRVIVILLPSLLCYFAFVYITRIDELSFHAWLLVGLNALAIVVMGISLFAGIRNYTGPGPRSG